MPAYAIEITEENIRRVIQSEAGFSFDLEEALAWLKQYEEGWFLRDPDTAFDCAFIVPEVFEQIYMFKSPDKTSLIRPVVRI